VLTIFALNSGGRVVSYFLAGSKSKPQEEKDVMSKMVIFSVM
jgi:hypothetical protein